MPKVDAVKMSSAALLHNAKAARKATDATWSVSNRAPVFCKITKKSTKDGKTKKFYRKARLLNSHAVNIAASGAAMRAAALLEEDCRLLRVDAKKESSRAPLLPTVSKGARALLEQFLCALAQEAAYKAHAVREGAGKSQRVNSGHMQLGWAATTQSVFGGSAPVSDQMIVAASAPARKAAKPAAPRKPRAKKASGADDEEGFAEPVEGSRDDLLPEQD